MSLNRCWNRLCDQKPVGESVYCQKCQQEKQTTEQRATEQQAQRRTDARRV
jgi:hypothetical protein